MTDLGDAQWRAARTHWRRAQEEVRATFGDAALASLHRLLDDHLPMFRPATGGGGDSE